MERVTQTAYLAPEDLLEPVLAEVGKKREIFGRLVLCTGAPKKSAWAQNIWHEPTRFKFDSISEGAKILKELQRNWVLYSFDHHRRAKLIQEKLPHVSAKPIDFPTPVRKGQLGSWTLLSPNEILCSPKCSSPFPNGEPVFVENKIDPPSRAYLKLYEALTLIGKYPKKGDICLDVGASPGGWTWVAAELGARVVAVDRSPLEPKLMKNPLVKFKKGNGFSITPDGGQTFDWVFSDVACYPDKLYEWLKPWLTSCPNTNFVCTLKFQGKDNYAAATRFASFPGARLVHLHANKHELTFIRLAESRIAEEGRDV